MTRAWFRTRRVEQSEPLPPPEATTSDALLAQIARLTTEGEAVRQRRDRAIIAARFHEIRQRDVAEAARLSIPRVKQIQQGGGGGPSTSPVMDFDVAAADAPADARAGRVFLLREVAPWLEPIASEREFFAQDPARGSGYDIYTDISDSGLDRWLVAMATGSGEIYCFQAEGAEEAPPEPQREFWGPGSESGPLYVLGRLPSRSLVEVALNPQTPRMAKRPGGLGWVYGRVNLINDILAAIGAPYKQLTIDQIREHLANLPEMERPRHGFLD